VDIYSNFSTREQNKINTINSAEYHTGIHSAEYNTNWNWETWK